MDSNAAVGELRWEGQSTGKTSLLCCRVSLNDCSRVTSRRWGFRRAHVISNASKNYERRSRPGNPSRQLRLATSGRRLRQINRHPTSLDQEPLESSDDLDAERISHRAARRFNSAGQTAPLSRIFGTTRTRVLNLPAVRGAPYDGGAPGVVNPLRRARATKRPLNPVRLSRRYGYTRLRQVSS